MAWRNAWRKMARAPKPDVKVRRLASTARDHRLMEAPPKPKTFPGWTIAAIAGGIGATIGGYALVTKIKQGRAPVAQPMMPRKAPSSLGGSFNLTNKEGKVVTNEDFKGKWVLIYFGYTGCPEDCPKQLQKLADVVKVLEAAGKEVVPIFITIDPERDSADQLNQYTKEFHPKIVPLRGDPSDIRPVLWRFRVYFKKNAEIGSDYLVDHSSCMYLMNKNMECVKSLGPEYGVEALLETINKEMKNQE